VITPADDSVFERLTALFMVVLFWTAFGCLAAGVAFWLIDSRTPGPFLLVAGLMGLLTIPIVRLLNVIAASVRQRDWITLSATLAVMAILFALTLRDASSGASIR
jgi:hypothetical protein